MSTITVQDGTTIYYKDWGKGQPVVFSHGWPLSSDDWDAQMLFFLQHGYRVIALDRRGHGRSDQTWEGNDMDHCADDLAELTEKLDLRDAIYIRLKELGKACEGSASRFDRFPEPKNRLDYGFLANGSVEHDVIQGLHRPFNVEVALDEIDAIAIDCVHKLLRFPFRLAARHNAPNLVFPRGIE